MGILDKFVKPKVKEWKEKRDMQRRSKRAASFAIANRNMLDDAKGIWYAFGDWSDVERQVTPPTNDEDKSIMGVAILWQAAIALFCIEKIKLAVGWEVVQELSGFRSTKPPEPSWPHVAKYVTELTSKAAPFVTHEGAELLQDISARAKRIEQLTIEEVQNTPEYKICMYSRHVMPGLLGSALSGGGISAVDYALLEGQETFKTPAIVTWVKTLSGHEALTGSLQ